MRKRFFMHRYSLSGDEMIVCRAAVLAPARTFLTSPARP
jgi:hypothetical protein